MIKTMENIIDEAKVLRVAAGLGINDIAEINDADGKRIRIRVKELKR